MSKNYRILATRMLPAVFICVYSFWNRRRDLKRVSGSISVDGINFGENFKPEAEHFRFGDFVRNYLCMRMRLFIHYNIKKLEENQLFIKAKRKIVNLS